MTFGSLFAGIGGIDLGLERAGMKCRWQVEIDPFCTKVLEKHWPGVRRYGDIKTVDQRTEKVDVIAGGFPCQDISYAGFGVGIEGSRSGLWVEFHRVVCMLRPRYIIVENVAALLDRGIGRVLGDLADCGYDADWSVVSSCSMGATHMRRRVFIVAYPNGFNGWQRVRNSNAQQDWSIQALNRFTSARVSRQSRLANPSELYRGADGIPFGMDRNRAIGNSVDPDVAQWIGERIMQAEEKIRSKP